MTDPNAKVQKFLPQDFVNVLGKNLPALYKGFNENIKETETLFQACIDQMFLSTASGRFLVQRGQERGFVMPANSGLDVRAFRTLVPVMVSNPKQVRITIDDLVQAFYGVERLNPSIESAGKDLYSILDGDDLEIETESGSVSVAIIASQVSDINNVSAQEISAILNAAQDIYIATTIVDRSTNLGTVKLTSRSPGAGSFIRVVGGRLQNILKFPNVIKTNNTSTTTWNITKTSTFTDEIVFTWDGIGINPRTYLANINDVVTIRGLVDGVEPFSELNGSYRLIEVGYDFFKIRNEVYEALSAALTQPDDNNIVFTSEDKISVFDKAEFAITSETTPSSITITVPAVPPLVRRFLSGSAHIRGSQGTVQDFERSFITVDVPTGQDVQVGVNQFVLSSNFQRFESRQKKYKTLFKDNSLTTPTYNVDSSDEDFAVLPFTVAAGLTNTDPIFGTIDSDKYLVTFPFAHGLNSAWGFTLAGFTGAANVLAGDINKEQFVNVVSSRTTLLMRILTASGDPIVFDGIAFGFGNISRHSVNQNDGSDFFYDFTTAPLAAATGLTPGITFKLDPFNGVNVNGFLAAQLRFRTLTVTSVTGQFVNFSSGLGTGPQGSIILGVDGKRSGAFGGSLGTYFFDKTSTANIKTVMNNLTATFLAYTSPSNPAFVGPYLFDTTSEKTNVTVSGKLATLDETIFKGESQTTLQLVDADAEFPQSGEFIIGYGTDKFEGPIRFNAFISSTTNQQLIIDPSHRFTKTHLAGETIQFIHADQTYVPTIDGGDYPFYITGTNEARNTLFRLAELLVASGIFVEQDVLLPDLRYEDTAINPFA